MHCYTQCPQPCSRPPPTHASARDSWTLTGMSGSVSCGVTAPFSCVLVHTRFCLSPLRVYFPVLCKFWQLYGRVNRDLLKGAYAIAKSAAPRAPAPAKSTADPYLHRRYQTQFCLSLVGVSGSWSQKVCLSPLSSSGGYGVWFQVWLHPSYCLAGSYHVLPHLLCPWTLGISSKSLQCRTAASPQFSYAEFT